MYRLSNAFISSSPTIAVVGCGGTGGFVAEGLCRMYPEHQISILLVDHDRVEEHNLMRQNYAIEDLGRFKSQALAERLASRYGRPVAYSVNPFTDPLSEEWAPGTRTIHPGLLIGCVDNPMARAAIASWCLSQYSRVWWVDVGNGEHFGQVAVGNTDGDGLIRDAFIDPDGVCVGLPMPTIQRPELLYQEKVFEDPDCAEAVAMGTQSPTINQIMAAVALDVVRRLIDGSLAWMQVSVDMEAGTMQPTDASPETVARITNTPVRKLIRERR